MIEALQAFWNDHVPYWFTVRCTDRFIGHMLFLGFMVIATSVISYLHVTTAEVLQKSLLGGMFFAVTRFILHRRSTRTAAGLAVFFVVLVDGFIPWLVGSWQVSSWSDFLNRLPLLGSMAVLELLEEESLEEEMAVL